ncbi:MAG: hypothetical protein EOP11_16970 [Proteobacteria bacterium]|nr:MAG: hypothetical protein EOP11_16970 [Pseudomonadota bacterium]
MMKRLLMGIGMCVALGGVSANAAGLDITLIADYDHGNSNEIEAQTRALQALKAASPELDCLFMEVDPSVSAPIADFMAGRGSYYSTVAPWVNQLEAEIGYSFRNVIPSYFLTDIQGLGLKVYGVDVNFRSPAGAAVIRALQAYSAAPANNVAAQRSFVESGIVERNRLIARNARSEFLSRRCTKAALIVGASHLDNTVGGIPSLPLWTLLIEQGFAVTMD